VIRVPVEVEHDEGYNYIEDGRDAENSRDTRTRWEGIGSDVHHFESSNDKDGTSGENI
jgi:hypothetical protein